MTSETAIGIGYGPRRVSELTGVCERGASQDKSAVARGRQARDLRIPLLLAALAFGLTLWAPAFHHHDSNDASSDCPVCLTIGTQSWDLPTVAAAIQPPLPAAGQPLARTLPASTRAGVERSETPRGPPLS